MTKTEPLDGLPMSEEHAVLRCSSFPFVGCSCYNAARKNEHVALYEIGSVLRQRERGSAGGAGTFGRSDQQVYM